MLKPAFSTVACPEWTLPRVAESARQFGFEAVELRTFGPDSRLLACDPALSDDGKVRSMFARVGVEILSVATSVRFDAPVRPPVIGLAISDTEKSVREGKRAVDQAIGLGCPYVRVFAFEAPPRERLRSATARIGKRLAAVLDHARTSGVKLVLENGGSFPRARDIAMIIADVRSPLLGACYALDAGVHAGDEPAEAVGVLGDRLWSARIKDARGGAPVRLGTGELPCREFVHALTRAGFDGPLVYEWPKVWAPDLEGPEAVLPHAATTMFGWIAEAGNGARAAGAAVGAR